jgi:hypothetical protein
VKCDIQILGIVSLKAATRADEMAIDCPHDSRAGKERGQGSDGNGLAAWCLAQTLYAKRRSARPPHYAQPSSPTHINAVA